MPPNRRARMQCRMPRVHTTIQNTTPTIHTHFHAHARSFTPSRTHRRLTGPSPGANQKQVSIFVRQPVKHEQYITAPQHTLDSIHCLSVQVCLKGRLVGATTFASGYPKGKKPLMEDKYVCVVCSKGCCAVVTLSPCDACGGRSYVVVGATDLNQNRLLDVTTTVLD